MLLLTGARNAGPGWTCLLIMGAGLLLTSCNKKAASEAPVIRPVQTVIAAPSEAGERSC